MTDSTEKDKINMPDKDTKIKELEAKVNELENNWKRALADYINFKNRVEEERVGIVSFANSVLISRFLIILDNLELLDKHIDDEGLKCILKDFRQILVDENVREMEALGKEFDSSKMEAIETVEGEKNKVVEVTQKGYYMQDKLLRPTRVKIGKG